VVGVNVRRVTFMLNILLDRQTPSNPDKDKERMNLPYITYRDPQLNRPETGSCSLTVDIIVGGTL
jgi:hypothetical protein